MFKASVGDLEIRVECDRGVALSGLSLGIVYLSRIGYRGNGTLGKE